jgi:hypothetical protein
MGEGQEGESFAVSLKIRAPGLAGQSSAKRKPDYAVPSPVRLRLWLRRDRVEAQRRRRGEGQDEGGRSSHSSLTTQLKCRGTIFIEWINREKGLPGRHPMQTVRRPELWLAA